MKIVNEAKIEFLSRSINEGFARVAVAAMISQLDPTVDVLSDIKTVISEAVTNSIVHGYDGMIGFVSIECRIFDEGTIELVVSDCGRGIADVEKARQPLYTSNPEMERSGMGFTVMEAFMDEVLVESALGKGTKVIMRKKVNVG